MIRAMSVVFPRLGIEVSEEDREKLTSQIEELGEKISSLQKKEETRIQELLPDVMIFHRAAKTALEHQEFFASADVKTAFELLRLGNERADQLAKGEAPWTTETGLVVRGFISRLDQTVQPYGLVIPESYSFGGKDRFRLDIWFHGRGETVSEVKFIQQRRRQIGQYAPAETFVLHPYGRYSNAFKFAGEVDVLEALEAVQKHYRIDEDRISVRGFSMGGAGCWQFAVHYADRWFAANPGAGFSETPEFLKFFQKEKLNPTWYEKKLWHLYDCPDYATNLIHCPTVAYSGEIDIQKQAADIMEAALKERNIDLVHIIGPKTGHKIYPDSKKQIEQKMTALAKPGRKRNPLQVHLETYTLKYNKMHWVTVNRLAEHWEKARVDASFDHSESLTLSLKNVTDVTLHFDAGEYPFATNTRPILLIESINGQSSARQELERKDLPRIRSDRSWSCRLYLKNGKWQIGTPEEKGLRKRHNLQGPIDDAFMDSFIIVKPTKPAMHEKTQKWVQLELQHAIEQWRQQFRGDARVKNDTDISTEDIRSANLILFGDPQSNAVLEKIVKQLPLTWDAEELTIGGNKHDAKFHAPVMIHPNPLNPERYIVINSGFTYREYDYLNNARQVPKLPDWAIIDVRTSPGPRWPGKIVGADFFDEEWNVKEKKH